MRNTLGYLQLDCKHYILRKLSKEKKLHELYEMIVLDFRGYSNTQLSSSYLQVSTKPSETANIQIFFDSYTVDHKEWTPHVKLVIIKKSTVFIHSS